MHPRQTEGRAGQIVCGLTVDDQESSALFICRRWLPLELEVTGAATTRALTAAEQADSGCRSGGRQEYAVGPRRASAEPLSDKQGRAPCVCFSLGHPGVQPLRVDWRFPS